LLVGNAKLRTKKAPHIGEHSLSFRATSDDKNKQVMTSETDKCDK